MSDQILPILKKKLEEASAFTGADVETQRNVIKEELQYYVLDFIYHNPEYSKWTMYGGSALRICHGLNRMSVDLDFEIVHPVSEEFLETLRQEVSSHFTSRYGLESDLLTIRITTGRGLLLRFHIGDKLEISHPSKQIHVKIDLNHFDIPNVVVERHPINHDQLSFVIRTYNMSTLMASKIAAIFLRGERGVGEVTYQEKGRDIYDLIWYMEKRIIPDLNYLKAKGVDAKNPKEIFVKLTLQMNNVSDANLKQDLTPLFLNRTYVENWLQNWRESYFRLLDKYEIYAVTQLRGIKINEDSLRGIFYFVFEYQADEGDNVRIVYALSDYWLNSREGELQNEAGEEIARLMEINFQEMGRKPTAKETGKLGQYAAVFYQKNLRYLEKSGRVIVGGVIDTKLIRMTADNLNQKEQIVLNRSALLACELEDLLK